MRTASLAALLMLLAVGACADACKRRRSVGQACAATSDCERNLACTAGRCAMPGATATGRGAGRGRGQPRWAQVT